MYYLGLTGGIASGKSTVAQMFVQCGAGLIDADAIVHDLYRTDANLKQLFRLQFGDHVIAGNGEVDRQALGKIVHGSREALSELEHIVHPLVREVSLAQKQQLEAIGTPLIVHDIPLLFERSDTTSFDGILVVHCSVATQQQRIMTRYHCDRADAKQRIAMQMPLQHKVARADYTIDTDADINATTAQVQVLYNTLTGPLPSQG